MCIPLTLELQCCILTTDEEETEETLLPACSRLIMAPQPGLVTGLEFKDGFLMIKAGAYLENDNIAVYCVQNDFMQHI